MGKNLEIEFKNMLTELEYNTLLDYFGGAGNIKKQTNIYFDTRAFALKSANCALRIRITEIGAELTLKEGGLTGNLETTDEVTLRDLEFIRQNHTLTAGTVKERLNELSITMPLYEIASLTTRRFETAYKGQLLVLDKSEYYGMTDYELEMECENYDGGLKIFNEFLSIFKLSPRPSRHKIARAAEYKNIVDK